MEGEIKRWRRWDGMGWDGRSHDKGGKEGTNRGGERSVGVWVVYKEKMSKGNAREAQNRK